MVNAAKYNLILTIAIVDNRFQVLAHMGLLVTRPWEPGAMALCLKASHGLLDRSMTQTHITNQMFPTLV